MNTVFLIFAALSGICAFGFLLAAVITFQQHGAPGPASSSFWRLAHVLSGGWISVFRGVASHWRSEQELRRLVYAGLVTLLIAIVCVLLVGI